MTVYYKVTVSDGNTAVTSLKSNTITVPSAPTKRAAVTGDGASLYWRLDDAAGSSRAADSTSNGDAGIVSGDVTFGGTGALSTTPNGAAGLDGTGRLASTSSSSTRQAIPRSCGSDLQHGWRQAHRLRQRTER